MSNLIDKDDTLKIIADTISLYGTGTKVESEILSIVSKIPCEEPKKGRWVPVTNGRGGNECSACHSYAPSYKNGDEHLSAYCPNCGAKMEVTK